MEYGSTIAEFNSEIEALRQKKKEKVTRRKAEKESVEAVETVTEGTVKSEEETAETSSENRVVWNQNSYQIQYNTS